MSINTRVVGSIYVDLLLGPHASAQCGSNRGPDCEGQIARAWKPCILQTVAKKGMQPYNCFWGNHKWAYVIHGARFAHGRDPNLLSGGPCVADN